MAYPLVRRTLLPFIRRRIGIVRGVEHLPEHGPFLVAANHVSYLETVLLAILVVQRTKQRAYSLTKYPVWRFFHRLRLDGYLGLLPVFREKERKEETLRYALDVLRKGSPVILFPEGRRSFDGTLLRGKTGVARLAFRSGLPVIPVGYSGPAVKSFFGTLRTFFGRHKHVGFTFGEPMRFSAPSEETHESLEAATTQIMERIAELLGVTYSPAP